MNSLRVRLSIWFCASFVVVAALFMIIAYWHLDRELRLEKWERAHPDHPDWILHDSYSDAEVRDIVGELIKSSLFASVPMILAALIAGYFLARKSTLPVEKLNAGLQSITSRNLSRRIVIIEADPDFRSVQDHINKLLDRLEKSFRQLNEFSARVAHELRTPLTLMRLQIEQAAGKIEPELSESLQEELKRLSEYVNQALLMARADQGRLDLKMERVNLGELLGDMIDVYRVLASADDRIIGMRRVEDCWIAADKKYLRQILHNLLTNALKHGRGKILIRQKECGGRAVCTIFNEVAHPRPASELGIGMGLRVVTALASLHTSFRVRTRVCGNRFAARFSAPVLPSPEGGGPGGAAQWPRS